MVWQRKGCELKTSVVPGISSKLFKLVSSPFIVCRDIFMRSSHSAIYFWWDRFLLASSWLTSRSKSKSFLSNSEPVRASFKRCCSSSTSLFSVMITAEAFNMSLSDGEVWSKFAVASARRFQNKTHNIIMPKRGIFKIVPTRFLVYLTAFWVSYWLWEVSFVCNTLLYLHNNREKRENKLVFNK